MKKFICALASVLLTGLALGAQDAKQLNSSIPDRLYGVYYINDFSNKEFTPAPKGYKPFYISHYGRHGARYQDKARAYTTVLEKLEKGHAEGKLTPFGEDVYSRIDAFCKKCMGHEGELTRLGWEQHRAMAHRIYGQYPSVFKSGGAVTACSSTSHRCVMSMSAFCLGLKECKPSMNVYAQCSKTLLDQVNPSDKANTNYVEREIMPWPWEENYDAYVERRITREEADGICLRLFNDLSYVRDSFSSRKFTVALYNLVSSMGCVSPQDRMDDIFTVDELFDYFETINVGYFEWGAVKKEYARPIIASVISDASEDMESGKYAMRLRFGHDTCLQALLFLLDVNGMGKVPQSIDNLSQSWHCWMTPMAATLTFIFYRNAKGDVLVKPVLNSEEVSIGVLTPVQGPYYSWEDFKSL